MDKPRGSKLLGMGLPWFSEDQWLLARQVMEDGATFHDSYAQFLAHAEQTERRLRREGKATIRIHLVVEDFVAWCRSRNRRVNGESRAMYAALHAAKADGANPPF